jgi:hypothetical protein
LLLQIRFKFLHLDFKLGLQPAQVVLQGFDFVLCLGEKLLFSLSVLGFQLVLALLQLGLFFLNRQRLQLVQFVLHFWLVAVGLHFC